MITRRTLLKFIGLLRLVGPAFAKAMIKTGATPALPRGSYLPAWFPKWDNAVDGLESAGKWAMEIDGSRLPSRIVFPRVGQVWKTLRDCEINFRPCFCYSRTEIGAGGQRATCSGAFPAYAGRQSAPPARRKAPNCWPR